MGSIPEGWQSYLPMRITLFGDLTVQAGDSSISAKLNGSRKMSGLLAYLLLHSGQNVTVQELLDVLWPENERDDPVNALKTLVYRVRLRMKEDGIPYYKECILAQNGTYRWNPRIPCEVDALLFESSGKAGLGAVFLPEKAALLEKAVAYYTGEFLPCCSGDEWVIPLNVYYHSLYLRVVLALIPLREEQKDDLAVVELCRQALAREPLEEELHCCLLQAFGNLSRTRDAEEHYLYMKALFAKRLGVTPSEKVRSLYQKIVDSEKRAESDLTMIKKDLQEPGIAEGAFVCEYSMFKQIFRLETRKAARSSSDTFLALLTLHSTTGGAIPPALVDTAMNQLLIISQTCLRKNDVIARYSGSQYVLMLLTSTAENARTVMERIQRLFQRQHPGSPATIRFRIQPLIGDEDC